MEKIFKSIEKSLLKYSPSEPYLPGSDEYVTLSNAGLIEKNKKMSHDEICSWLIKERNATSKQSVVSSFLIGLATNAPQMRCALPAFAFSTHFVEHSFSSSSNPNNCQFCLLQKSEAIDFLFIQSCRWTGSLVGSAPLIQFAALYLESHQKQICYHDTSEALLHSGIEVLKDILSTIESSDEKDTPSKLAAKLKKLKQIKLNDETSRSMVDLFGYIGVLQPHNHKSHIQEFISGIPPTKSHSSDWSYPVDFWTGKDGINPKALNFWFDEFL